MPTTATLRTNPAAETTSPALPAAGPTWAELLAGVPGEAAHSTARKFGATVAARGTCGETTDTWEYVRGHGRWVHVTGDGPNTPPADAEIIGWPGNEHREHELAAAADRRTADEYAALAELADSLGETAEFRVAVEALHEDDPYALDGGLYARLTGAEIVDGAGEPEDDEDRLSGR